MTRGATCANWPILDSVVSWRTTPLTSPPLHSAQQRESINVPFISLGWLFDGAFPAAEVKAQPVMLCVLYLQVHASRDADGREDD